MPNLIDVRDGNYVDANLIFRISVMANTVVVFFGRDVNLSQRQDIKCETQGAAIELAAKIVADVALAAEPQFLGQLGRADAGPENTGKRKP
jgi:hypothetical protein